jgi:hypothetical protein
MANIQQFYQRAQDMDFSRDFLFQVTSLTLNGLVMGQADLVYATTAKLPSRTIRNIKVPYMGLDFNVPGGVQYEGSDAYELTFYLDAESKLRNFFEEASRNSFDEQNGSTGDYKTPDDSNVITLMQLDKQREEINTFNLFGASIRKVNDIEYKMAEGTGETVKLNVTIAYHFYNQSFISDPFIGS